LEVRDHLLLTVIWLRLYPIHEVLGYLFGVSGSTVSRLIERVLPLLEQNGRDGMCLPDLGRKRRRQLPDLLRDMPELTGIVESFEQRVQRPPRDDRHYSGKKKQVVSLKGVGRNWNQHQQFADGPDVVGQPCRHGW
jgi:hypothetical protein